MRRFFFDGKTLTENKISFLRFGRDECRWWSRWQWRRCMLQTAMRTVFDMRADFIFVANIVRGAKMFTFSPFLRAVFFTFWSSEPLWILHMKFCNVAPHKKIACCVKQFCQVDQWQMAPYTKFLSTWQIYNVCCLVVIYSVLTQNPFCHNLCSLVLSKNWETNLVRGAEMTNMM